MTNLFVAKVAGIALLGLGLAAPVFADTPPTPVTGPATQAPAPSAPAQGQTPQRPKDKGGKKNSGNSGSTVPK
jgi:hypothetical protein